MAGRHDERFRPHVSPPRDRGWRERRFISQVIRAGTKAGAVGVSALAPTRRLGARRGRGQVAARFSASAYGRRTRRVVVKARLVILKTAGARSTPTHLRYLARSGVTHDGGRGHAYGALTDSIDAEAFEMRGRDDRHQFRFIVTAEDGAELGDLRGFTRSLMSRMEGDLGTRLDWVAVDHWDTDNPHTHVVLRGKDDAGRDLVIAREYVSHGMRARAAELATEWLGPRSDREIESTLDREVSQRRWTSLDRVLARQMRDGRIDLSSIAISSGTKRDRARLIGRLQVLATMGLADRSGPDIWTVRSDYETVLKSLAERDDIVRTMQRALKGERRELVIGDDESPQRVIGRIAGKGLVDELHDQSFMVVDGIDGRAHYVRLPARAELTDFPLGAIIDTRQHLPDYADRTVAAHARNGIYRVGDHVSAMRVQSAHRADPTVIVQACLRRLEALRRAGIVERISDGVWRVPADLPVKGRSYNDRTAMRTPPALLSLFPIEQQLRVMAATWLDQQLLNGATPAGVGFGAVVTHALRERETFLIEHGLAERRGGHLIVPRNLLATLRAREVSTEGARLASETGLTFRPVVDGQQVSGIYRRSVALVSGRFSMIDDGIGFSLVPWRPVIESRLGRNLSGLIHSDDVTWDFRRHHHISR